jgi:hypothetical protein
MRERRTLTSERHFFTTARVDEGTFFMEFANFGVALLWSIDQWQPLRPDWSRIPLRQVRKNKEPLRNVSEGDSQVLSGLAIGLCRMKIRH